MIETTLSKPEYKGVKNTIETVWMLMNQHLEFCFFAKEQTWNDGFWVGFLRWYGLDRPDV